MVDRLGSVVDGCELRENGGLNGSEKNDTGLTKKDFTGRLVPQRDELS